MGKFRAHQDKSRRGRGKSRLNKKGYTGGGGQKGGVAAGTLSRANGHGRPDEQHKGGHADMDETAVSVSVSGAEAGGGGARKKKPRHVTYGKEHSVLICGDGDFSFTRGVIRHRGTGVGVVATSLDSRDAVLNKYPRAESWLAQLDEDGAQVVHGVDATRLPETLLEGSGGRGDNADVSSEPAAAAAAAEGGGSDGKHVLFDRIVFNFPHTGKQRTHLNRNLIRDFFSSTRSLVKCATDGGEIHVTLKNKRPYSDWNVRAMAKESGLVMVRSLLFDASVFPGYCHSTTDPKAKEFDAVGAKTHVFCRGRSALDDNVEAPGVFPRIVKTTDISRNGVGNGSAQVTPKLTDVDNKCSDFNGGNEAGRAAQNPAATTLTEEENEEEDDDFDTDFLNALCDEEDDEENDGDGWNIRLGGKVEEGVGASTSRGDDGLMGRSVLGESRDSVLSPSSSEAGPTSGWCKDKSMSKSARRTQQDGCLGARGGQETRVGGGGERDGRALGAAAGDKGQRHKPPVTDEAAARVLEEPLLFGTSTSKRKAEKRRALRKKAAAARKAAAASAAGVEVSSAGTSFRESAMKDAPASSHPKRKRGKYVRSANKRKVGGPSPT